MNLLDKGALSVFSSISFCWQRKSTSYRFIQWSVLQVRLQINHSSIITFLSFSLQARYTDPQTKLYYATAEEFSTVRSLPMDITAGYLALRGASSIVGWTHSINHTVMYKTMYREYSRKFAIESSRINIWLNDDWRDDFSLLKNNKKKIRN